MPDYKTMYFRLFNRVTDAIHILQDGQREGEQAFIESGEEAILLSAKAKEPRDSI
ncbi:hypothetical protein U6B65_02630 [Oscillospiraceae bacterium MB08-C2-2]|nr:hypothetical protein U6B65_02630 [Oscillospiraceae bacterium MB08-C2-2]